MFAGHGAWITKIRMILNCTSRGVHLVVGRGQNETPSERSDFYIHIHTLLNFHLENNSILYSQALRQNSIISMSSLG